ncbi:tRNA threonylcarbamoyladenosine biosynthesis protein TsaE [Ereboglobus sp. PH5-10]|nr:tRNA threonylcarbamoyladenosine biosynthesis protein TsaE [Ereboglobus sp. PH5-10]
MNTSQSPADVCEVHDLQFTVYSYPSHQSSNRRARAQLKTANRNPLTPPPASPVSDFLQQLRAGLTTHSAEETRSLAERLAHVLPRNATLALHGDLGAGKTTFVQGLAHGLGIQSSITSPTFTIFTIHRGPIASLVHLDAYRLENDRQIDSLMLEDFLITPYILAVEWPEKIASWLPETAWHFSLGITPEQNHFVRLDKSAA